VTIRTIKTYTKKGRPFIMRYPLTPIGRLFVELIEMLYAWAAKNGDALSKLRRKRKKHTASTDKARKVQ
jgi:DNA-binding HxlR family transcriptional regulator